MPRAPFRAMDPSARIVPLHRMVCRVHRVIETPTAKMVLAFFGSRIAAAETQTSDLLGLVVSLDTGF